MKFLKKYTTSNYDRYRKLLVNEGRIALWHMCSRVGVNVNGVPGQACRLIETYFSEQLRIFFKSQRGSSEWLPFKQSLLTHLPLTMMSCVQLASKMNGAPFRITAGMARIYLACKGFQFTLSEIIKSELEVFFALNWCIPILTNVEIGHLLATEVGMPKEMLPGVSIIVDSAEFRLNAVHRRMLRTVNDLPIDERKDYLGTLSALHLVAGCVIATALFLRFKGVDPAPRLADLTNANIPFLRCISNIIYSLTVLENRNVSSDFLTRKRKWPY
ncbi:unnamed protein product [Chilo suppressalis]|uniref:Cyclin C-terminal domain-containing protein n=1 Tax=Chilo suppressalis TaxID=168631 RepID=A0ABN8L8J2_CHISP|nr:unnamed protein product [Chilo suppressalis]